MSSWQGVISVNKAKWWVELFVGPKAYRINSIFIHHQSDDMHYVIHTNPFWARSATLASANIGDSLPNWKRLSCHHTSLVLVDKFKCSMYVCHLIIHIFVQYVLMLNKNDKRSGFRRLCLQPPPRPTPLHQQSNIKICMEARMKVNIWPGPAPVLGWMNQGIIHSNCPHLRPSAGSYRRWTNYSNPYTYSNPSHPKYQCYFLAWFVPSNGWNKSNPQNRDSATKP